MLCVVCGSLSLFVYSVHVVCMSQCVVCLSVVVCLCVACCVCGLCVDCCVIRVV